MPSSSITRSFPQLYSRPSTSQAAADAIPFVHNSTYHLFHLSTPPNTVHHPPRLRSTWSRLRSQDLVSWERDDKPALSPGASTNAPDADGAWTGSAVTGPDGRLHIFYTGYNLAAAGRQVIIHAIADDADASTFTKSTKSIDIVQAPGAQGVFEDIDFRDPYVFHNSAEGCYWMLVATRLEAGPYWTRGCLALLTSEDLQTWTLNAEPLHAPNDLFCPECPELWQLGDYWYLVYSRFSSPGSGTIWKVSTNGPRGPFRAAGRFDGRRWYAAKSCAKIGDPEKRVFFGWTGDKCKEDGKWLWGGSMALPRAVSAGADGRLMIEPVDEAVNAVFPPTQSQKLEACKMQAVGTMQMKWLDEVKTATEGRYKFEAEFKMLSETSSFGLLFRTDADMHGHQLRLVPLRGTDAVSVALTVCPPPLDDFWADQYKLYIPRGVDGPDVVRHDYVEMATEEHRKLTVLVMGETLEVFVGGRVVLSYRLQDNRDDVPKDIHELGLFVDDGEVEFSNLRYTEAYS